MSNSETVFFIILSLFAGIAVLMIIFRILTRCGITPQRILEKHNDSNTCAEIEENNTFSETDKAANADEASDDEEQQRKCVLRRRVFIVTAAVILGLFAAAAAGRICGNIAERQREQEKQHWVTTTAADLGIKTNATRREQDVIDLPYVGMPESRIYDTSLGAPDDEIRHNNEMIGGLQYTANLYDFKVNGWTVFIARCVNGEVTDIWDYRRDPLMSTKHTAPPPGTYGDNEFDVYDYYMPEDFYADHYDDFYDYYEAEEYFYEHQ